MKKLILFTFIALIMAMVIGLVADLNAQTVSLNMESGNRSIDAANCWSFPSVSYTNTSSSVISGSYTAQTGQLSGSTHSVISPWLLNPSGTITFKHRLSTNNSATDRKMRVISYDYNTMQYDTLYTYANYTSANATTAVSASVSINKSGVFKLFFSFTGTSGNSRGLIDDIIIPATYNSSPANGCIPANTATDTDGDGVIDSQDDYPNDATLAFNNYMNANYSSLMFEDLWPGKGDYDFNDLVVNYRVNRITNASNKIAKAQMVVVLRAIGASYKNGFAFQINNLSPSKIISISGQKLNESLYTLSSNGTEASQTYAVIPVFDNALKTIGYTGGGSGVNVETNGGSIAYDSTTLTINFDVSGTGVSLSAFGGSTFNPFIVINQTRGRELHKANDIPTSLVNNALFGTVQDRSNPSQGVYYKTANNHPWVIETSSSIAYMKEKNQLTAGYLKLIDWVISGGTSYTDWYSNTSSGYRDASKIY